MLAEPTEPKKYSQAWLTASYVLVILIPLLVALVHPAMPWREGTPDNDPAVYAYMGQTVLDGRTIYVDAWDHKGPLSYLLNAGALLVFKNMQVAPVMFTALCAAILGVFQAKKIAEWLDVRWAFAFSCLYVTCLNNFETAFGYLQTWCLPFQLIACMAALSVLGQGTQPNPKHLGIAGLCAGAIIMIRPDMSAICFGPLFIAWGLSLPKKAFAAAAKSFAAFSLGALILPMVCLLYVRSIGAMSAMSEAYLAYNRLYTSFSPVDSLNAMAILVSRSRKSGLGLTMVLALAAFGYFSYRTIKQKGSGVAWLTALFALVCIYLGMQSGRTSMAYSINWIAPLWLLFAVVLATCRSERTTKVGIGYGAVFLLLAFASIGKLAVKGIEKEDRTGSAIVALKGMLGAEDSVYVWGMAAPSLVRLGKPSPVKYFYALPVLDTKYTNASPSQLADDLAIVRPTYILDTGSGTNLELLDNKSGKRWPSQDLNSPFYAKPLDPLREWVQANYDVARIENGISILKLKS